ncbi:hypothetical protein [Edwardsiella phage PVN06]|nr:hypothetical protein [Edwardsiella phage PVN06]
MNGLGNHEFSTNNNSIWKPDLAVCPYCGYEKCEADFCDVGVGLVQCGPYHCDRCHAIEIGVYDKPSQLSNEEEEKGWYAPGRRYVGCANTVNGELVNHDDAKKLYEMGLLDDKE